MSNLNGVPKGPVTRNRKRQERENMKTVFVVLLKYRNREHEWSDWETFDTQEDAERFQEESLTAFGSKCTRAVVIHAAATSR